MNGMKKVLFLLTLLIAIAFSAHVRAVENPRQEPVQTVCPVLGEATNRNIYVDYEGKRIYFCCTSCIADFKKDPQTYLKRMKELGIVPENTPAKKK